jgi:hypothetical protein
VATRRPTEVSMMIEVITVAPEDIPRMKGPTIGLRKYT